MIKLILLFTIVLTSCCPLTMTYSKAIHIVGPGQTLEEISVYHYGSELQMNIIMEANYLKADSKLRVGQRLKIPTTK